MPSQLMILHGPLSLTRDTDSTEGLGFTCSPQGHGKAQAGDLQALPLWGDTPSTRSIPRIRLNRCLCMTQHEEASCLNTPSDGLC
jgi:hypothetical protein